MPASWLSVRMLPVVCWALLSTLASSSAQAVDVNTTATTTTTTTTRFSFSHVFAVEASSESFLTTLKSHQDAVLKSQSELIVITSPPNSDSSTSSNNSATSDDAELKSQLPEYSFADENRVVFKTKQWQPVRDAALNGSVWTRLKAQPEANTTADMCVVVLPAASMDSPTLIQLALRVNTFCAPQDIVMMGFTEPVADELAQYLKAETAINGQYAPRIMKEVVGFAQLTTSTEMNAAAALNRLFIALPVSACVESASGMTESATKTSHISVKLCAGPGCSQCTLLDPGNEKLPDAGDAPATPVTETNMSSGKRGLVVLLSCGSFLIGCALVFYIFFRKQFFMPSESTKPEKELNTNLAYVLRM